MISHLHTLKAIAKNQGILPFFIECNVCILSTCCTIMYKHQVKANPIRILFLLSRRSIMLFLLPRQCITQKKSQKRREWRYVASEVGLLLFSTNKICNDPSTWYVVTSHYPWGPVTTLKWLSQHPLYGLWMRVKDPYCYMVKALGLCVKWPWGLNCTWFIPVIGLAPSLV